MARQRAYRITLRPEEKAKLESIVSSEGSNRTVTTRCRILLAADESQNDDCLARTEISETAGASLSTVTITLKAYLQSGLDGVLTLKRSERSDTARLKTTKPLRLLICKIANEAPPTGCNRWSASLISQALKESYGINLSKSSICRALKSQQN